MRAQPFVTPMHRGRLPACSCRHPLPGVDGPERPSGRNASFGGITALCGTTPSTIMSPTRSHPGPWTEIRLGARAHAPSDSAATAPVKRSALGPPGRPRGDRAPPPTLDQQPRSLPRPTQRQPRIARLPRGPCTDKEQRKRAASLPRGWWLRSSPMSPKLSGSRVLSGLGRKSGWHQAASLRRGSWSARRQMRSMRSWRVKFQSIGVAIWL
jgi:hypothetical protein